jgi:Cytochrome P460
MKKFLPVILIIVMIITVAAKINRPMNSEVPYPEGFRNWTHIKTGYVGKDNPSFNINGGFHHIYANEKAMQDYLSGNFPEGSILVFDVLEGLVQANSNIKEGNRRHVDVMVKDSIKYNDTGGWGYEEFNGDSKTQKNTTPAIQKQCFNCHASQKDYVFSEFRN